MPWYHLLMVGMICLFIKEALFTSDTVICVSAGFLHNQMGFTSRPRWIFTNRCLVSEWLSEVHWNNFSQNATLHQSSCVMNCKFLVCFAWSILKGTDQARALKPLCYDPQLILIVYLSQSYSINKIVIKNSEYFFICAWYFLSEQSW